ncbi:hemogen isoform X2 [Pezoporus occidentalis]|uniref:hemogen isoform X2 n=1 Tax=Pezoporus occidentalis TaxID=407982 RepID=UPI002F908CAA
MTSPQQHNSNFDPSDPPTVAHKQHGEEEIPISRRLRDREMLRKRKKKAQEKNSADWIYREPRIKRQRKAREDKKGRSNQLVVELKPVAELKVELEVESQAGSSKEPVEQLAEELEDVQPKPKLQEKAEPVAPKPAPPEPLQQEQSPVLTTPGLGAAIPMGGMDGELSTSSQDAVGDEELLNLTEAEIPEDLNAPLDSLCQDNEHIPFLF